MVRGQPLILVLYVDDLILTGDEKLIGDYKKDLAAKFDMKDIGLMHYFLGLEVCWVMDKFSCDGESTLWRFSRGFACNIASPAMPLVTN